MPLLLESGDRLLLEDGFNLLLETDTLLATGYTLTGPTSLRNGRVYTYTLTATPEGNTFFGDEVFTLTVEPSGGLSSETVTPDAVATTATFTYTPASTGEKSLGVSNDQAWPDPSGLTLTVTEIPPLSKRTNPTLRLGLRL